MKIILEAPSRNRRAEFLRAVSRSRTLHRPWVSAPSTVRAFDAALKKLVSPSHVGFWVVTEDGDLAGAININDIVRGSFWSGYLGYYAFMPHNGQGYISCGLRAVLAIAFEDLGIHRLEANIQPQNEPSRRLVERLGFRLEGFSLRYLKVAGEWRDHERWAITAEEWAAR